MTDIAAGFAALAVSLVLTTVGLAIRRNAFGVVTRNAQLTAKLYGRLKDPCDIRASVERNSRSAAAGFLVVGGVMTVVDTLWLVKALL